MTFMRFFRFIHGGVGLTYEVRKKAEFGTDEANQVIYMQEMCGFVYLNVNSKVPTVYHGVKSIQIVDVFKGTMFIETEIFDFCPSS